MKCGWTFAVYDVTYRSDFDETFLEELTDIKHLSADDISLSQR